MWGFKGTFPGSKCWIVCCFLMCSTECTTKVHFYEQKRSVEIKCQLDATDDFYCRSYCLLNMFWGHHYAHHQELESIIQVVAACGIWCFGFQVVSGLRAHNPQLHIIPKTLKSKHQIPQTATTCIILSSSWWWAHWCPKHVEQAIRSAIKIICCIQLAFYFHILTTMHGQNHIKKKHSGLSTMYLVQHLNYVYTILIIRSQYYTLHEWKRIKCPVWRSTHIVVAGYVASNALCTPTPPPPVVIVSTLFFTSPKELYLQPCGSLQICGNVWVIARMYVRHCLLYFICVRVLEAALSSFTLLHFLGHRKKVCQTLFVYFTCIRNLEAALSSFTFLKCLGHRKNVCQTLFIYIICLRILEAALSSFTYVSKMKNNINTTTKYVWHDILVGYFLEHFLSEKNC